MTGIEEMLIMNKRNGLNMVAILVVGAALLAGCDNAADAGNKNPVVVEQTPDEKTVEVMEVATEPFTSVIQATGKALPVRESLLSLEVSGTIDKIFVKEGDWVKKGKVLLRFNQKGFYLEVQHAKAALAAAETQANQLEIEVNRIGIHG